MRDRPTTRSPRFRPIVPGTKKLPIPRTTAIAIPVPDGMGLGGTVFEPAGPARATIVVHSALAVQQSFYGRFAGYAAQRGYRVLTYDYRGIGRSAPPSLAGFQASLDDWAKDALAALAAARDFGDPVFHVGHSFGGQLLALAEGLRQVEGAVLVGSQLGYVGHFPFPARARFELAVRALIPLATRVFGYLPGALGLGADVPAGAARQWAAWCRHPRYLLGHVPDAEARLARFDRPLLFYSFTDDDFAPAPATAALTTRLSPGALLHRHLAPRDVGVDAIGHFGFFRRDCEPLWRETVSFWDAVLAGKAPSFEVPRAEPFRIERWEIMADLEYGRA